MARSVPTKKSTPHAIEQPMTHQDKPTAPAGSPWRAVVSCDFEPNREERQEIAARVKTWLETPGSTLILGPQIRLTLYNPQGASAEIDVVGGATWYAPTDGIYLDPPPLDPDPIAALKKRTP